MLLMIVVQIPEGVDERLNEPEVARRRRSVCRLALDGTRVRIGSGLCHDVVCRSLACVTIKRHTPVTLC